MKTDSSLSAWLTATRDWFDAALDALVPYKKQAETGTDAPRNIT